MLNNPIGVTWDPLDSVYVADMNNHRIQLYMNGQLEGMTIAGISDISGTNSTLLDSPFWVKLDNQLNLYVADYRNVRIQKCLRF